MAEMLTQMTKIAQNPLVATEVELSFHLPKGFRWLANELDANDPHMMKLSLGNVSLGTDLTFGFEPLLDKENAPIFKSKRVPVQLCITFTRPNGSKFLRVVSDSRRVSNASAAEEVVDVAVVGLYALQSCADKGLALLQARNKAPQDKKKKHPVTKLRQSLYAWSSLIQRCALSTTQKEEFAEFQKRAYPLDDQLKQLASTGAINEDNLTKAFSSYKSITISDLFSGARKTAIVQQRAQQSNQELDNLFYSYKFNEQKANWRNMYSQVACKWM